MTVRAYLVREFLTTYKDRAFDDLLADLHRVWGDSDETVVLLGNFYCQGSEIDAAIFKRDSISILDFEDHGGKITFSGSGQWYADGVEMKEGGKSDPYLQIQDNKAALLNFLKSLGPLPSGRIFHRPIDASKMPRTVPQGFHVVELGHSVAMTWQITSSGIDLSLTDIEAIVKTLKRENEARERLRQEEQRKRAQAQRDALLKEIRKRLHSDFLSADSFFQESNGGLIGAETYKREKVFFVKSWVAENTPGSINGEQRALDDEQAAAIASVNGHVQVVARAGSGKTTTLVNRALFLLKHCGVDADEMLLLAFNRKAASELRRRLLALLHERAEAAVAADIDRRTREASGRKGIDRGEVETRAVDTVARELNINLPHVMTFHALAYAIVHPEESLLYNGAEGEAQGLSRAFQRVIDAHLQIPAFRKRIRELMLAHFREDWDRIVNGCYDQSKDELLQFRRSLPRESLGGEYLKSYGEKVIADSLFEHDVAYRYERNHWWSGINYRPDFTVFQTPQTPQSGVIIEYFGLKGDADYDKMSEEKRQYWAAKRDWALIEFAPSDIARDSVDSFKGRLKTCLEEHGIQCTRLSEDKIWFRIRDRAIDRFTTAMVGFIGRCRKQSLSPPELRSLVDSYSPLSIVEEMFLNLAHDLYVAYLERLPDTEDFDGLMQRAGAKISAGQTLFERKSGSGDLSALRYVCIDEFQDFSDLFYRLLNAIRKQNPEVELFCVGDDWQAINGFAGSDLRFFDNFQDYIGESCRLHISTNYRSSQAIVTVGNALMDGLGRPAIAHKESPGKVLVSDLNVFEPTSVEEERHRGDKLTPAVLRLASKGLKDGFDVVMLCRRNELPRLINYPDRARGDDRGINRYLDLIQSFFPKGLKERISISTVHKYKGLEEQMVIVLDVVARSYPLIHPDWVFSSILGDSLEKIMGEERRLLYVALTRAVETLVIVTDGGRKSTFMEELESRQPLSAIDWADFPPVQSSTTRRVVKVGNQEGHGGTPTVTIKDLLKATGYRWRRDRWEKSFPAFSFETLKAEVWTKQADGVEVQIFDDTETLVDRYLINAGQWCAALRS